MDSPVAALSAEHRAAVAELLRESGAGGSGATFPVVVRGGCMRPLLEDGQTVRVRRQAWALPGDVVAFERGASHGGLAVHRLLGMRPSRAGLVWVTQADNEPAPDPAFRRHRLLGVADLPVSLSDRVRALGRFLPALLAPFTMRVARPARGARRQAVPVSRSASR
ncbi:MAG: S24/S26 family peptidase [Sandaracinaceae bacterium]|nr:S24/S26 family peptidase [Sandaracinaceae bacterium]MBP7685931.1 S24/S26 family peptidase [Deltaproteobacteria bacterium]